MPASSGSETAVPDDNIIRLAELRDEIPDTSEEAMALLFADRHAHELRYVSAWGRWLEFDGTRWTIDATLHAFDRSRIICREVASRFTKGAVASAKTVAAIERLARADRRLGPVGADRKPGEVDRRQVRNRALCRRFRRPLSERGGADHAHGTDANNGCQADSGSRFQHCNRSSLSDETD